MFDVEQATRWVMISSSDAQFPFGLAVDRRHGETLANDWYHVLGIGFNGLKCSEDASNCSVEKRDIELGLTMKPYTSVDSTFFRLVMNG
jgi:hypothetical protein